MSIYTPREFVGSDERLALELIRDCPFATLITAGAAEPAITPLPMLHEDGALWSHMAKPNPHWQAFATGTTLAIFHGPHAYVSPTWYAEPALAVPTWNVATVHVLGRLELLPDRADAERVIGALVERFEGNGENAWRFAMQGAPRDALLANVAAFRIVIERVTGKFKLSQNRTPADRRRVIQALNAGRADAKATAAWMQRYADPDA